MNSFRIIIAAVAILSATNAFARGHSDLADPIYSVNPASVSDGRCSGSTFPEFGVAKLAGA